MRPVSPLDHVCPHCGAAVGQFTPFLPYEGIRFNAQMEGKLWKQVWFGEDVGIGKRVAYLVLILVGLPFLLVALPAVLWSKYRARKYGAGAEELPSSGVAVGALLGAFVGLIAGVFAAGLFGAIWLFVLPVIGAAAGALKEWLTQPRPSPKETSGDAK
jgi:hypothetical protein